MITFSSDPARRIRTAVFTGVVTDAELMSAYGGLVAEPDYDPTLDDLADLRRVERLEVSSETLRRLVALFAPVDSLGVATRLAIVAASDLTFGMSRMYELLRGDDVPEEIAVFRSLEEAQEWLAASRRPALLAPPGRAAKT